MSVRGTCRAALAALKPAYQRGGREGHRAEGAVGEAVGRLPAGLFFSGLVQKCGQVLALLLSNLCVCQGGGKGQGVEGTVDKAVGGLPAGLFLGGLIEECSQILALLLSHLQWGGEVQGAEGFRDTCPAALQPVCVSGGREEHGAEGSLSEAVGGLPAGLFLCGLVQECGQILALLLWNLSACEAVREGQGAERVKK